MGEGVGGIAVGMGLMGFVTVVLGFTEVSTEVFVMEISLVVAFGEVVPMG